MNIKDIFITYKDQLSRVENIITSALNNMQDKCLKIQQINPYYSSLGRFGLVYDLLCVNNNNMQVEGKFLSSNTILLPLINYFEENGLYLIICRHCYITLESYGIDINKIDWRNTIHLDMRPSNNQSDIIYFVFEFYLDNRDSSIFCSSLLGVQLYGEYIRNMLGIREPVIDKEDPIQDFFSITYIYPELEDFPPTVYVIYLNNDKTASVYYQFLEDTDLFVPRTNSTLYESIRWRLSSNSRIKTYLNHILLSYSASNSSIYTMSYIFITGEIPTYLSEYSINYISNAPLFNYLNDEDQILMTYLRYKFPKIEDQLKYLQELREKIINDESIQIKLKNKKNKVVTYDLDYNFLSIINLRLGNNYTNK